MDTNIISLISISSGLSPLYDLSMLRYGRSNEQRSKLKILHSLFEFMHKRWSLRKPLFYIEDTVGCLAVDL